MGVNGIYGLSGSGLDIESMVKVGMMSKQNEYDKMAQKYTKNEWTKNALIEINNQITTFNMSSLSDYKMSSKMNAKTATSSNEAMVTASASATAAIMSHKVSVDSLSANAYLISKKKGISDIINTNATAAGTTATDVSKAYLKDILFSGLTDYTWTDITRSTTGTTTTKTKYGNSFSVANSLSGTTSTSEAKDSSGNPLLTVTKNGSSISYDMGSKGGLTATPNSPGSWLPFSLTNNSISGTLNFSKNADGGWTVYNNNDLSLTLNTDSSAEITLKNSGGDNTVLKTNTDGTITKITQGTTFDSTNTTKTVTQTTTFADGRTLTLTTNTVANGDVTKSAVYKEANGVEHTSSSITTNDDGTVTIDFSSSDDGKDPKTTGYLSINLTTGATGAASIDVITREEGITGKIVGNGGDVSTGFTTGNGSTVKLNDVAFAFKIGDGEKETAVISYKYQDLLGYTDDNGTTFKAKTMNDLISDINKAATNASLNVKATYDNNNELFSLYNSKGGKENKILITAVTTDANGNTITDNNGSSTRAGTVAQQFFNALGLKQSAGGTLVAPSDSSVSANNTLSGGDDSSQLTISNLNAAEGISGTNGKMTIDGVEYDDITDNKVTVGGVTYNALNVTPTGEAATVTIGQDVDAIVDRVKSFVESYNKILGDLYAKYDEKKESGYTPLTQAQKDQMKDEQVEKWEEKAKKGLLYHDQTLSKIIGQMRNAISGTVEGVDGKYNSVYSIGISTTGIKGQLVLDETKLKNALAEDGDSVYNVFAKLTTEDENGVKLSDSESYNRSGIAQRLGDIFTSATKLIRERAGSSTDITEDSSLNNLLRELQTKMSNFKKLMTAFEDRLYKKYDAMEVTLSKLGSQLNFITGGQ